MIHRLQHAKTRLALHELRAPEDDGAVALLWLHGLGEAAPESLPEEAATWPGAVFALDFTGHGHSSVPRGGGYTAEVLMGDADAALAHVGPATVCGRGLGAYVALMLAGARPESVQGAVLCDGPGLAGGGPTPLAAVLAAADPRAEATAPPDPFALLELSRDLRPADYATAFVRQTTHLSELERPITVCARQRPEWLAAVVAEPGVEEADLAEALAYYAGSPDRTPAEARGEEA